MDRLRTLIDAIPLPETEPFIGESLRADGWEYRDLPRMTREAMLTFTDIVGVANIRWLSFADYGQAVRGQLFISPAGMENMRAHLRNTKN